jgi:hypothetical protein
MSLINCFPTHAAFIFVMLSIPVFFLPLGNVVPLLCYTWCLTDKPNSINSCLQHLVTMTPSLINLPLYHCVYAWAVCLLCMIHWLILLLLQVVHPCLLGFSMPNSPVFNIFTTSVTLTNECSWTVMLPFCTTAHCVPTPPHLAAMLHTTLEDDTPCVKSYYLPVSYQNDPDYLLWHIIFYLTFTQVLWWLWWCSTCTIHACFHTPPHFKSSWLMLCVCWVAFCLHFSPCCWHLLCTAYIHIWYYSLFIVLI